MLERHVFLEHIFPKVGAFSTGFTPPTKVDQIAVISETLAEV